MERPFEHGPARLAFARAAWFAIGSLALMMGAIGIVLPGLPTTVFVIVAAFAFSKCSPRLHGWLLSHHLFGPILHDWETRGAIAPRFKAIAIVMMLAAIALSYAMGFAAWVLSLQALCMLAAASYILTRPSH